MIKKIILLLVLLTSISILLSQSLQSNEIIKKEWLFSNFKNNIPSSKADTSSWVKTSLSQPWQNIPKYKDYYSTGLYAHHFKVNKKESVIDMGIYIPMQTSQTHIYLNGSLLGKSRSNKHTHSNIMGKPCIIKIPSNYLIKGTNTIILKLNPINGAGGIFGQIAIGPYENIKNYHYKKILIFSFLISATIFLSLFFILIFLNRRKEIYYFFFSAMSFCLAMWLLGYKGYIFWIVDSQLAYNIAIYLFPIFIPALTLNFLNTFFFEKLNKIPSILYHLFYSFLAMWVALELFFTQSLFYYGSYGFSIFSATIILIVIYGFSLTIKAYKFKKPDSIQMAFGMGIFGLFVFYSILCFLQLIPGEPWIIEGFFISVIIFATVLASRFAQVHNELEESFLDLIETNKIKDQVLSSLEKFKHIVSSTNDLLLFIDDNCNIQTVNQSFKEYFYIDDSVNIDNTENLKDLFYIGKVKHQMDCAIQSSIKNHSIESFEGWYNFPAIKYRYIEGTIYPFIENNELEGLVLSLRDETKRLNIEQKVVEITQAEQKRIGSEIHDAICQDIKSIILKFELYEAFQKNNKKITNQMILEGKDFSHNVLERTRKLSHGLYPIDIEAENFIIEINDLIIDFQKKFPNIIFSFKYDTNFKIIENLTSTQLFYITLESLRNSIQHSQCTTIDIHLKEIHNNYFIKIQDNGVGISKMNIKKGIGLQILRYRARMINAELNINDSKPGVLVECTFRGRQ